VLAERSVVNAPATRDIASRGRDLVGRGAVGVNLLVLSPQFGEVSLVRLKKCSVCGRIGTHPASRNKHAARMHARCCEAHTPALSHSLRRLDDAAIPETGPDPSQRGVAAGGPCGKLPQGFGEDLE
jgi:hypothetical protein